jgi:hypothetical protein
MYKFFNIIFEIWSAYRKQSKFSHKELLTICKAESIDDRVKKLNEKYLKNCYLFENELIKEVNWY